MKAESRKKLISYLEDFKETRLNKLNAEAEKHPEPYDSGYFDGTRDALEVLINIISSGEALSEYSVPINEILSTLKANYTFDDTEEDIALKCAIEIFIAVLANSSRQDHERPILADRIEVLANAIVSKTLMEIPGTAKPAITKAKTELIEVLLRKKENQ